MYSKASVRFVINNQETEVQVVHVLPSYGKWRNRLVVACGSTALV